MSASLAAACALLHANAWAEPKPFVRIGLGPKTVTVGQPVALTVDVFVPTWFTSAPRFPALDVKDAVVMFLESGGENMNETVGEQSYAGQRRQYLIYPQRAGEYEVPAFEVKVRYAIDAKPSPRTAVPGRVVRFSATIPAAAAGLDHFLATPSFKMSEATDKPLQGLKAGDSFTRTITLTASDAFAIMLPPLEFPDEPGLAVYPAPPQVSDSGGERDEQRMAKRVESVTYVLQKEGDYRLPPIEIAWWDTFARQLRRERLPAVDFHVAANPGLAAEIPLPVDPTTVPPPPDPTRALRDALRRYLPMALLAGALIALGLRLFRARIDAFHARGAARRKEREASEEAALDRLEKAARAGQARELLAAAYRWLDRRTGSDAARLDVLVQGSGTPALPALADTLVRAALDGGEAAFPASSGETFVRGLVEAARRSAPRAPVPGALGPLNPEGPASRTPTRR
jgi:hypothetical protein